MVGSFRLCWQFFNDRDHLLPGLQSALQAKRHALAACLLINFELHEDGPPPRDLQASLINASQADVMSGAPGPYPEVAALPAQLLKVRQHMLHKWRAKITVVHKAPSMPAT